LHLMTAGFSLSRALQLDLPAHIAAIEEVSEYASKVKTITPYEEVFAYVHEFAVVLIRVQCSAFCCYFFISCVQRHELASLQSQAQGCHLYLSALHQLAVSQPAASFASVIFAAAMPHRNFHWSVLWTRCSQSGPVAALKARPGALLAAASSVVLMTYSNCWTTRWLRPRP